MAGIGFELRKIYQRHSLNAALWGSLYASISTIGPSILFSLLMVILTFLMDIFDTSLKDKQFFFASFTWLSLIAIIICSLLSNVLSRYISDCIYKGKLGEISSCFAGVSTLVAAIGLVCYGTISFAMYSVMNLPGWFCGMYFLCGNAVSLAYTNMTYITSIKEYRKVTLCYSVSAGSALLFCIVLLLLHTAPVYALYISLSVGFSMMNILIAWMVLQSFGEPAGSAFRFFKTFKQYPSLLIGGLCYMLGCFAPSIIYWLFSPLKVTSGIFAVAPGYDMALFLSIIVTMPALVLFIVRVETSFSDGCRNYLSSIQQGSYSAIENSRKRLIEITETDLFSTCEIQLIITIVLICLINVFFPYIGMNTEILTQFSLLSLGFYCIVSMYFTVVFLYYFEDYKSALLGPVLLLVITVPCALLCGLVFHGWYALPTLIGGLVSWSVSFYALRRRMAQLNAFIMCKEG